MSVELGLKDCRSDAVPVRREKEKRVRYRNVNAALIGTTREGVDDRNQAVWTEKNKYVDPTWRMTHDNDANKIEIIGTR